jgi:hypothetical protein
MGTVCEENGSLLAVKTDSTSKCFRGGRFRPPAAKLLESMRISRSSAVLGYSRVFFELGTNRLNAQSQSSEFVPVITLVRGIIILTDRSYWF